MLRDLRMRLACVTVLVLILAEASFGDAPPSELKSLHGTMVTMHGDTEGFTAEIWAKGNNVRSEIAFGDQKVVTIQRGDTMYTFGSNSHVGNKTQFEAGLASLGLIQQIATVKSKGKKDSTRNVDGTVYDLYVYEVDAPHEIARVLLNSKTSLPQDWDSTVKNADGAPATVRMKFRNLAANVDVPDELFALPAGRSILRSACRGIAGPRNGACQSHFRSRRARLAAWQRARWRTGGPRARNLGRG